jgi:hypothetical protein
MSVVMKNSRKVLPFPKPPEEPAPSTIVVQIGKDRFAIHWEMEELPLPAPRIPWERRAQEATAKIVKPSVLPLLPVTESRGGDPKRNGQSGSRKQRVNRSGPSGETAAPARR